MEYAGPRRQAPSLTRFVQRCNLFSSTSIIVEFGECKSAYARLGHLNATYTSTATCTDNDQGADWAGWVTVTAPPPG